MSDHEETPAIEPVAPIASPTDVPVIEIPGPPQGEVNSLEEKLPSVDPVVETVETVVASSEELAVEPAPAVEEPKAPVETTADAGDVTEFDIVEDDSELEAPTDESLNLTEEERAARPQLDAAQEKHEPIFGSMKASAPSAPVAKKTTGAPPIKQFRCQTCRGVTQFDEGKPLAPQAEKYGGDLDEEQGLFWCSKRCLPGAK